MGIWGSRGKGSRGFREDVANVQQGLGCIIVPGFRTKLPKDPGHAVRNFTLLTDKIRIITPASD